MNDIGPTAACMLTLRGELTFASVNQVRDKFFHDIGSSQKDSVHVDLANILRIDSAGLALMIEGIKLAKKKGKQLSYNNIPDSLRKLVTFYALDAVLGFKLAV